MKHLYLSAIKTLDLDSSFDKTYFIKTNSIYSLVNRI